MTVENSNMDQDALKAVYLRNDFYRHNYRILMTALILGFVIVSMLTSTLVYMVTHPAPPKYFAVSSEGRLTPMVPLKEPNLSNAALLQWATRTAVQTFSYNYVDYRESFHRLRDRFTDKGWENFSIALNHSNNLVAVKSKKLIVSAVPTGVPVIVMQGIKNKAYAWRVQVPLLVTYQSSSELIPQSVQVELLIVRTSTLQSVQGIGVQQLIMSGSGSIRD